MAREAAHVAQSQIPGCMTIGRQRCHSIASFVVMIPASVLLHEGDEVGVPTGLVLLLVSPPLRMLRY
ncbi:hypothetical protein AS156_05290 [Bradyrhizobium macuxiense]|uniref:Uncharacterized protein n=1 Tax=Bradyrhizobium macuxiense TaxID=1755647 RepID=A0A109JVW7_9BRAD|nr:hypothetical protein AS156_05290 [Bradyrhizobium macuxiense]